MIYFCFIFFLVVAFYLYKKRGVSVSFLIASLYLLMYFSSTVLNIIYDIDSKDGFIPSFYLFVALLLLLFPLFLFKDNRIKELVLPSNKVLRYTSAFFTFGSLFSIIYYTPAVIAVLSVGFENIGELRSMIGTTGENPFIQRSFFNTLASLFATFYMFQIILFFIYIVKNQRITKWSLVVLLSSVAYIFLTLAFIGRDGIVFWLFSFILVFSFFYKFLYKKNKSKLSRILRITLIIFLALFMFITAGRFLISEGITFKNLVYPFVNYLGQGPLNFVDLYRVDFTPVGASNILPLFFGEPAAQVKMTNEMAFASQDVLTNVFSTTIGSFVVAFGYIGTLCILLFVDILLFVFRPKRKVWKFSFLLIYSLVIMILMQGVFYFRLYEMASNTYILCIFLLAVIFKYLPKQKINIK